MPREADLQLPDFILYAIPVFFVLIGVEWILSRFRNQECYRLNDAINDLSMGSYDQIVSAFLKTLVFSGYLYVYRHYPLLEVPVRAAWAWVACFLLYDLMYYWAHRVSHERNFLWATHIPHHQSEEYNFAVALRQGAFQGAFFWVFYLPLALIGFPPAMFIAVAQLDTIYQFFIHTRMIGKLGPLEWFMNTPSHHRVHHAQNPKYIDKNHAGVFIVWDKLFGTFKEEEEEPVYGIVSPLRSWNPMWGTIHYWVALGQRAHAAPYWSDKLKLWFMPPAWQPRGLPPKPERPPISRETFKKFDLVLPFGLNVYLFVQFVALLIPSIAFLEIEQSMGGLAKTAMAAYLLLSLLCVGGLFERKRAMFYAELARLAGTAAGLVVLRDAAGAYATELAIGALGFAGISMACILPYRALFVYGLGPLPEEALSPPEAAAHPAPIEARPPEEVFLRAK